MHTSLSLKIFKNLFKSFRFLCRHYLNVHLLEETIFVENMRISNGKIEVQQLTTKTRQANSSISNNTTNLKQLR